MAYFAKLNENNVVTEVLAVHNNELIDENGIEREEKGIAFLIQLYGGHPYWKQTSYNASFRKNYAGYNYTYDSQRDAFVPPRPFASWVLDEDTCQWSAPVAYPADGKTYTWDEDQQQWTEMVQ